MEILPQHSWLADVAFFEHVCEGPSEGGRLVRLPVDRCLQLVLHVRVAGVGRELQQRTHEMYHVRVHVYM